MDTDVAFCIEIGAGKDPVKIKACHQVMANASPVFKVMLDADKFKEGSDLHTFGQCEIPLAETDAEAFQLLCHIFHLQSDMISEKPDINLLYETASLVDRYDCLKSIQPWPRIWKQENHNLFDSYSTSVSAADLADVLKMVHISSIFRFDGIFTNSLTYFLSHVRSKDLSQPVIEQLYNHLTPDVQGWFFHHHSAFDVADFWYQDLVLTRLDTCRQGMKALALEAIRYFEAGNTCKDPRQLNPSDRFNCASMILGNALLGMTEAFGSEWRKGDHWEQMPVELYEPMMKFAGSLNGPRWVRTKEAVIRGHTDCNLDKVLGGQIDTLYLAARKPPSLAELKGAATAVGEDCDWQTVFDRLLLTGCLLSGNTS